MGDVATDEPLLPPSLQERFRDPHLLGEGAFGRVVAGTRSEDGRRVAIKLFKAGVAEGWDVRFEREAALTRESPSTHVIQGYEHGRDGDLAYLVLEFVAGGDLAGHLEEEGGKLPVSEAVKLFIEILDGLRAAHGVGVLHRDLKPENVLLRKNGEAVLSDFGLARNVGDETITRTGTVMGTLAYMAPEVMRGEPASATSDLYAAVLMFCEMLTGHIPLLHGTAADTYERRERGGFMGVRPEGVNIPAGLDRMLVQALDPEPKKRPRSVYDFSVDLRAQILSSSSLAIQVPDVTMDGLPDGTGQPVETVSQKAVDAPEEATDEVDLNAPTSTSMQPAPVEAGGNTQAIPVQEETSGAPRGPLLVGAMVFVLVGFLAAPGGSSDPGPPTAATATSEVPGVRPHDRAAEAVGRFLEFLEDPDGPVWRYLDMAGTVSRDTAVRLHEEALLAYQENHRVYRSDFTDLEVKVADRDLINRIGRLTLIRQLMHVTDPEVDVPRHWHGDWDELLRGVMHVFRLPSDPDESSWKGPGKWRKVWKPSRAEVIALARKLGMPSPERTARHESAKALRYSGQAFKFASAGHSALAAALDQARDDITDNRHEDFWDEVRTQVRQPPRGDLILLLRINGWPFDLVGSLELVGAGETVLLPFRPPWTEDEFGNRRSGGKVRIATGIRLARRVLPPGLRQVRFKIRGVEGLSSAAAQGRYARVWVLEGGELPPQAAFPDS